MTNPPDSLLSVAAIDDMMNLAQGVKPGCMVEVGVYKGGTAYRLAQIARERGWRLHLFDTFTGIPNKGPEDKEHNVGDFGDASLEAVKAAIPDAVFHVGVFPDTMPADWSEPIFFVHVDCDQYSGVSAAIERLWPFMTFGGVMLFDDYGCTSGCTKAVDEQFTAESIRLTGQGKAYVVKDSV